jgi:DNA-binding transcriptional LysR family regulator
MDRLDAMTTFLAVVETGSFSAASRKMRVPVTTVSRRVADLKAHLRTKLLQRATRKVTLTDAGGPYVVACRKVLEQIGEAERNAAGEYQSPRGELTVTAPLVFGRMHLVPIIAECMAQFVDVRLNCRFHDRNLICRTRGSMLQFASARRQTAAGAPTPSAPSAVSSAQAPTILRGAANPARSRTSKRMTAWASTASISFHVRAAIRFGLLQEVLAEFAPPEVPVIIIHRNDELVLLKVRAFIDFTAPRLQARLAL